MKKLLPIFFGIILLFFNIPPHGVNAQEGIGFELKPSQLPDPETGIGGIYDTTERVTVTFTGDLPASDLFVCLRNDLCLKNALYRSYIDEDPGKIIRLLEMGLGVDDVYKEALRPLESSTITVCGAGESSLKTDCLDERDYFHAGHFYYITIFQPQGNEYVSRGRAIFFVNHHQPDIVVTPQKGTAPEIFKLDMSLDKLSKDGKKNANNFEIVFEGRGIKEDVCTPDLKLNEPLSVALGKDLLFPTEKWLNDKDNWVNEKSPEGVIAGKYVIKINEQINESNRALRSNDCQGGFTFAHFVCNVSEKEPTTCEKIEDPNESDINKLFKLLDALAGGGKGVTLPCTDKYSVKNPLDCTELNTAIGKIQLTPVGFVTRLFSIVLSIAGIGALLLIIYSGYRLLLSRGNKEAIQGARETITAAIVGLIFIVFSLVILSIITGDVLKIPGFG